MGRFTELLATQAPVILDGAGGTELEARGFKDTLGLWSAGAPQDAPELVLAIHRDYIEAGAQVITTQTFTCKHRRFRKAGKEHLTEPLTRRGVELAVQARREAGRPDVLVAGSMSSLELYAQVELAPSGGEAYEEHLAIARLLADAGADLLLIEAMGTIDEAQEALRAARTTGLDVAVSFVCGRDGRLLTGDPIADAVQALAPLEPAAVGVNCTPIPLATRAAADMRVTSPVPFGVYANVGDWRGLFSELHGREMMLEVEPQAYAQHALSWVQLGAGFVGGCCGTRPAHIRAVADLLRPLRRE